MQYYSSPQRAAEESRHGKAITDRISITDSHGKRVLGQVVYEKDYIVLRLNKHTDMIGVEYYKGDSSLDNWLENPSASFWAMAATLEFKEGAPHQVFFQGGTLKL